MSTLVQRFGIAVRQMRCARGWSQSGLAERASLDRSYLGEIERGEAVPSLVTLDKLATALEIEACALLDRCSQLAAERVGQHAQLTAIAR